MDARWPSCTHLTVADVVGALHANCEVAKHPSAHVLHVQLLHQARACTRRVLCRRHCARLPLCAARPRRGQQASSCMRRSAACGRRRRPCWLLRPRSGHAWPPLGCRDGRERLLGPVAAHLCGRQDARQRFGSRTPPAAALRLACNGMRQVTLHERLNGSSPVMHCACPWAVAGVRRCLRSRSSVSFK